ncbi:MAG: DUF4243 domain-containing protein [Fidelibacterota bacterium]|nr:MAG: DUF4243 domain-containing protein [Candidatus Neomarinimicrobiota bacterium]
MPSAYTKALTILAGIGPEYKDGRVNTVPAVADALVLLNRSDRVVPWIEARIESLDAMPPDTKLVTRDNWASALGDIARISDWRAFFKRELRQASWQVVLRDWLPRLAPGLAGAAGHGLLRTGHAIRNIALEESNLLYDELAASLGYWAARFLKLPGIIGSESTGSLRPAEALSRIKWQYKERPSRITNISDGLEGLTGFSPFSGVVNLVTIPAEPLELLSQITEAMARVFLSNSYDSAKVIPFIHSLVVPGALRYVIPYIEPEGIPILLRYGWQFAGALYAIYGRVNPVETCERPSEDKAQLADQAIATDNEFAIIFASSCLCEYNHNPRAAYLAAAREAIKQLAPTTSESNI